MSIKTEQLEKIFEEGYCFVDLLPYIEYDNEVFVLSDERYASTTNGRTPADSLHNNPKKKVIRTKGRQYPRRFL